MKVAFILGSGHCGSTLLDLLLDGHPAIAGTGEMATARPDRTCTCGVEAQVCPVWSRVLRALSWPDGRLYRRKLDFVFGRGPYRSVATGAPIDEEEYVRATVAVYRALIATTGATVIVGSSKLPERAELLATSGEIEPVIIHIVRDGRAVMWSYVRKYKRFLPFFFTWFAKNLKIEVLRCRWRGQYLFVHYKDLTEHPARELARVCAALNVSYDPAMLDFRVHEHHQLGGNRMRLGTSGKIRRDDAWRRDMPRVLRAAFLLCFGWLNLYYYAARRKA